MYILEQTGPVPLKEDPAILKAVNKLTFKWRKKGGKKAAKQGDLCRIGSNNTTGRDRSLSDIEQGQVY